MHGVHASLHGAYAQSSCVPMSAWAPEEGERETSLSISWLGYQLIAALGQTILEDMAGERCLP